MEPPSFAAVVSKGSSPNPNPVDLSFPASYHQAFQEGNSSLLLPATRRAGIPAIMIPDVDHATLLEPLQHTLVIKFQSRHPPIDSVREFLNKMKFRGPWDIGQLEGRHLIVKFKLEGDYALLFGRRSGYIANAAAKILKWTVDFDFKREPPIVPVWIKLPGLKLHLFNHKILFSIAAAVGRPLKLDHSTYKLTRPSCARILVELDLAANLPKEIWIGTNSSGYKQQIEYEGIPYYCKHCAIFGHTWERCFVAHPELRPSNSQSKPGNILLNDNMDQQHDSHPENDLNPTTVNADIQGCSTVQAQQLPLTGQTTILLNQPNNTALHQNSIVEDKPVSPSCPSPSPVADHSTEPFPDPIIQAVNTTQKSDSNQDKSPANEPPDILWNQQQLPWNPIITINKGNELQYEAGENNLNPDDQTQIQPPSFQLLPNIPPSPPSNPHPATQMLFVPNSTNETATTSFPTLNHEGISDPRLGGSNYNADGEPSASSESEDSSAKDSLNDLEEELNAGWQVQDWKKSKRHGKRELKALLKDTVTNSNLSSRRAPRRPPNPHSS